MNIFSIDYNKSNYSYTIKYRNGADTFVVATNETPCTSFIEMQGKICRMLKTYMELASSWSFFLRSVKYNDSSVTISYEAGKSGSFPPIRYTGKTNIRNVKPYEKDTEQSRLLILEACDNLKNEIKSFILGNHAQLELEIEKMDENLIEKDEAEEQEVCEL